MKTLFGTKGKMNQTFVEGFRIPVTRINLGPCVVMQIKTQDKNGYWSLQLGFGTKKAKNTTKPLQGHFNKNQNKENKEQKYPRYVREVRLNSEPTYKVGDVINAADIFKAGDVVSVSGITKGKGFAGGVRRFNFRGGPKTHGQSDRHRAPGSVGQTTTPGRVYKGKRMAGRMGGEQVTVKNIHVVSIDFSTNEILVSGQVPGVVGGFLTVNKLKAGSLKDLEHEVVAQVVEGEASAEAGKETTNEG